MKTAVALAEAATKQDFGLLGLWDKYLTRHIVEIVLHDK